MSPKKALKGWNTEQVYLVCFKNPEYDYYPGRTDLNIISGCCLMAGMGKLVA